MPRVMKVFDYVNFPVSFGMNQLVTTKVQISRVKDDEVCVTECFDLDGNVTSEVECAEVRVK